MISFMVRNEQLAVNYIASHVGVGYRGGMFKLEVLFCHDSCASV